MFRWMKWFLSGAFCAIVAAVIIFPIFARGEHPKGPHCKSNLKQIGLAILVYSQHYDEKMPLVAVHAVSSSTQPFKKPYGWADAVQPYRKSMHIFQCLAEETSTELVTDAVRSGFTDYWMNTNLSGISQKNIENVTATLLCGDGNDGKDRTDARYNRNALPLDWIHNAKSPARRHVDMANYLFADGHVKAVKPQQVKNTRASSDDFSFATK